MVALGAIDGMGVGGHLGPPQNATTTNDGKHTTTTTTTHNDNTTTNDNNHDNNMHNSKANPVKIANILLSIVCIHRYSLQSATRLDARTKSSSGRGERACGSGACGAVGWVIYRYIHTSHIHITNAYYIDAML